MRKPIPALLAACLAVAFTSAHAQATTGGLSKDEAKRHCQQLSDKPDAPKETLQACIQRVLKEGVKKEAPKK